MKYENSGPIDCSIAPDLSSLAGKTAIVTGGSSGLGEAYVRALVAAKAYVCIGDINVEAGEKLAKELPNAVFVECDTTTWDDQVGMFKKAAELSPTGRVHYVIANAGISAEDEVWSYSEEPKKPSLKMAQVNTIGTLYSTHLALHYFVKQNGQTVSPQQEDCCLILIGSGAAFLDCPRTPEYQASKFANRGIMHAMRQQLHHCGARVNLISPWYVETNILPKEVWQQVKDLGIEMATLQDASACLGRLLSDPTVTGRGLFLCPRIWAPRGYCDFDLEDFQDEKLREIARQQMLLAPGEAGLFV